MKLFHHENRQRDADTRRVYARFELAHTIVDFGAALFFLVASILFFWESTQTLATWGFVIGSVLFTVKPALRLAREIKLAAMGDEKDLAERYTAG